MPRVVALLLALLVFPLAIFALGGFLHSFEPPGAISWRIVYFVLWLGFASLFVHLLIRGIRGPRRKSS